MPVADAEFLRFGGHTMCAEVSWETDERIVVDCGTGLHRLSTSLEQPTGNRFHVLVTHYHHDHLQGLPFFPALYEAGNSFVFYGERRGEIGIERAIAEVFRPPWFPVTLEIARADITYVDLEGDFAIGPVRVSPVSLHHPQGVTGFRFDTATGSVTLATDTERSDPASIARFERWAAGTRVLIHDGQYVSAEYETMRRGWGHSTWAQAVAAAESVGADELIVVSHDPTRTDDQLDALEKEHASEGFPVVAAREGMRVSL